MTHLKEGKIGTQAGTFLTGLPAKRSTNVSPSTSHTAREGRFLDVSDHIEMIEQDIRAVLEPNFPPAIVKSDFKLDEYKVISSELITMGTEL